MGAVFEVWCISRLENLFKVGFLEQIVAFIIYKEVVISLKVRSLIQSTSIKVK